MKLKSILFLLLFFFASAATPSMAIDYPKELAKYIKALLTYSGEPNSKNEAKMEKLFDQTLDKNPQYDYYLWQLRGEAYYHPNKTAGFNAEKAFNYYSKALEFAEAKQITDVQSICLYNLSLMYLKGDYVKQDYSKCLELANESMQIDQLALMIYASCYRFGLGVEKDEEKAFDCYHKALRNGIDTYSDIYSLQWNITH